jgi:hypothetical protein
MGKFSAPGNRAAAVYQRQKNGRLRPYAQSPAYLLLSKGDKGEIAMTIAFDHMLLARVLLTLNTAGWAFATVLADFNKTHATNPKWTGHARFHVVWQISSYVGLGLLALALIWWPGPLAFERLVLVALMSAIVYAGFFAALLAMPVYGGKAYDSNGYKPFAAPVPLIAKKWDVNVTIFCVQIALLAAGVLALVPPI